MMVGTVQLHGARSRRLGGEVDAALRPLLAWAACSMRWCCGRPPFVGDETVAIIGQHLNTPPVAPSWHRPDCPPALEALILRLLEKDPAKRPASRRGGARRRWRRSMHVDPQVAREPSTANEAHRVRRREPALPPHLRRPRGRAAPAPGGLRRARSRAREPGHGGRRARHRQDRAVRAARDLRRAARRHGRWSATATKRARSPCPTCPSSRRCAPTSSRAIPTASPRPGHGRRRRRPHRLRGARPRRRSSCRPPATRRTSAGACSRRSPASCATPAAVQPLLLVLEDLHWCRPGHARPAHCTSPATSPGARLLIVGTYRDVEVDRAHPLSATLAELRRIGSFARVPLRGLDADEVQRMMNAHRRPGGAAGAWRRRCTARPRATRCSSRRCCATWWRRACWRATGAGSCADGTKRRWRCSIPEGLRDVIGKRLSRLSRELQPRAVRRRGDRPRLPPRGAAGASPSLAGGGAATRAGGGGAGRRCCRSSARPAPCAIASPTPSSARRCTRR